MDTLKTIVRRRRVQSGFSLVEVTIAVGIVGFAFVSLLGLVPTGLNTFHQAMDRTVGSTIVQTVMGEAQQTDFDELIEDSTGAAITGGSGRKAVRYFDDQGAELVPETPGTLSAQERLKAIYWVNTRVMPVTSTPSASSPAPAEAANASLATITIQIAKNPGNRDLAAGANNLWNDSSVSIATFAGLVARNK